jgi:hypothetical protein
LNAAAVAVLPEDVPQDAADHPACRPAEVKRCVAVVEDDAPVAIDRIKRQPDALENRVQKRRRIEIVYHAKS